ncbi:MAG: hypothetical protein QXS54_06520 [Candidatus Methanomethylicaceae archaeon]
MYALKARTDLTAALLKAFGALVIISIIFFTKSYLALGLFLIAVLFSVFFSFKALGENVIRFLDKSVAQSNEEVYLTIWLSASPHGLYIERMSRDALAFHPFGSQILNAERDVAYQTAIVFSMLHFVMNHYRLIDAPLPLLVVSIYIATIIGEVYRSMLVPIQGGSTENRHDVLMRDSIFWSNVILFAVFAYKNILLIEGDWLYVAILLVVAVLFMLLIEYIAIKIFDEQLYQKVPKIAAMTIRSIIANVEMPNLYAPLVNPSEWITTQDDKIIFTHQTAQDLFLHYLRNGHEELVVMEERGTANNRQVHVLGLLDIQMFTNGLRLLARKL